MTRRDFSLLAPAAFAAAPARSQWLSVADRLAATPPSTFAWDWGEGVQICALMEVWGRTKNAAYPDFAARWADHHLPSGIDKLLANVPDTKQPGYCGRWVCATALDMLAAARPDPRFAEVVNKTVGFIRAGATRSPEGALGHWLGNYEIWVDTLDMACPLLARRAGPDKKPEYLDDAVNQFLVAARHMLDAKTSLFCHMWNWEHDRRGGVLWGRGNGWIVMSLADTFEFLPKSHPHWAALRDLATRQARGLLAVQNKDGVWHTILDDPSSYAECSSSMMIAYGFLKMARLGILPPACREAAKKAWATVNSRWISDDLVTGVSAGTGPYDRDHYLSRQQGTFPWGTGAYLMAGAEIDRLG